MQKFRNLAAIIISIVVVLMFSLMLFSCRHEHLQRSEEDQSVFEFMEKYDTTQFDSLVVVEPDHKTKSVEFATNSASIDSEIAVLDFEPVKEKWYVAYWFDDFNAYIVIYWSHHQMDRITARHSQKEAERKGLEVRIDSFPTHEKAKQFSKTVVKNKIIL